jgi:hypothetical protein
MTVFGQAFAAHLDRTQAAMEAGTLEAAAELVVTEWSLFNRHGSNLELGRAIELLKAALEAK